MSRSGMILSRVRHRASEVVIKVERLGGGGGNCTHVAFVDYRFNIVDFGDLEILEIASLS